MILLLYRNTAGTSSRKARKIPLEVPFKVQYTDRMKNKATIEKYEELVSTIHKDLQSLKALMDSKAFQEAVTWDQEENDGESFLYGCFESFLNDTAETYARG